MKKMYIKPTKKQMKKYWKAHLKESNVEWEDFKLTLLEWPGIDFIDYVNNNDVIDDLVIDL